MLELDRAGLFVSLPFPRIIYKIPESAEARTRRESGVG